MFALSFLLMIVGHLSKDSPFGQFLESIGFGIFLGGLVVSAWKYLP